MFGAGKFIACSPKIQRQAKNGLTPHFQKKSKTLLEKALKKILVENRDTIQEQRQRFVEAKKQQRQAETLAAEREKTSTRGAKPGTAN